MIEMITDFHEILILARLFLLSTCGYGVVANISGGGSLSNGRVGENWKREGNVSNGGVCGIINFW